MAAFLLTVSAVFGAHASNELETLVLAKFSGLITEADNLPPLPNDLSQCSSTADLITELGVKFKECQTGPQEVVYR